jgi:hypothetical protein
LRYDDDSLEVVIFRNEEWLKVLFHELMHLYSYDMMSNDHRVDIRLSRIFNVETRFNLTESYCEFWARLLWTLWEMRGRFKIREFREKMDKQRKWSMQQALIVMTNMDIMDNVLGPITDEDGNRYVENNDGRYVVENKDKNGLTSNINNIFRRANVKICKETTSAFSYYVITGFLMSEWENVLYWCCQTNVSVPIRFTNYIQNVWSFITLIREIVNDEDVKEEWNEEEDKIPVNIMNKRLTARMSV